jgi:hypothetical protein
LSSTIGRPGASAAAAPTLAVAAITRAALAAVRHPPAPVRRPSKTGLKVQGGSRGGFATHFAFYYKQKGGDIMDENNKIQSWKNHLSASAAAVDNPAGFVELDDWEAWGISGGCTNTCGCCNNTCGTCCGSSSTCTCPPTDGGAS